MKIFGRSSRCLPYGTSYRCRSDSFRRNDLLATVPAQTLCAFYP
jgi:hypothetical protein